ncbi:hypothetical protein BD414DRAFT_484848 [Trametes punicea]|nr:hypothetical protein BD414DRAFT_498552 [Trametes punicea]KAI8989653.1 hypothetical protein BD414DRAFT_484848 [Trametes punicea]
MSSAGHTSAPVEPVTIELDGGSIILQTEYDYVKQKHKDQCDICGLMVYINNRGNSIFLTSHRRSKNCDEFLQKRRRKQEQERILAIRQGNHSARATSAPQTPSPIHLPCAPVNHGQSMSSNSYQGVPLWSPTPTTTPRSSAPTSLPTSLPSLDPELHPTDSIQSRRRGHSEGQAMYSVVISYGNVILSRLMEGGVSTGVRCP